MDGRTRELCKQLRAMQSAEAASWLMENYKIDGGQLGEAFTLVAHRSWTKSDQLRLARYFLQDIPFGSPYPLRAFATFMPIRTLVMVIREHLPRVTKDRLGLLRYFLSPLISEKSLTDADVTAGKDLIKELKRLEAAE